MSVNIIVGDIFEQDVDCIVNPAHPSLLAGSGLCGQIFKMAGKKDLESYCLTYLQNNNKKQLNIGEAVITPAFQLPFKNIIHSAVPKYFQHGIERLSESYFQPLRLAEENIIESIAFPALGIGINQIPATDSAKAFRSAIEFFGDSYDLEIRLVVRDPQTFEVFQEQFS
ncbi:O-acetyl-ADP-ribose deacetylase [Candidatus Pacearchaeota archaeon]|nr:O-acetyl-ADP-ribose deacetylase [Candidatus Pacearchaeota archaeon]